MNRSVIDDQKRLEILENALAQMLKPVRGVPFSHSPKFRLVDLHDLVWDVKYEFNSDNRRLYAPNILLLQDKV